MIAVIRIHGRVKIKKEIEETLGRLNIRHKLYCTLINEKNPIELGMIKKVKEYITYGEISDDIIKKIIQKRGEMQGKKKVSEKEIDNILESIKKGEWKIKKFFRLHPPIGGFKKSTKMAYPRGVLGNNQEIDKLLEKML